MPRTLKPRSLLVAAWWLSVLLWIPPQPIAAFPPALAHFILGRPVTENEVNGLLKSIDASIFDPIIEGTDAISVSRFTVGEPKVELSVLIVEPRRYGIEVRDSIKVDGNRVSYTVNVNFKPPENAGENKPPTAEEWGSALKAEIGRNGRIPSTTGEPRTLFLLPGYGVSKKAGLPLALLMAKHGVRTVMPDLRGQGESGGSGVTWGKHEPADLMALLTTLREKKIVEPGQVSVAGVSYGAAMAALWAAQDPRVESLILVAPYQKADARILATAEKFLGNVKLPFTISQENLAKGLDLAEQRLQVSWEDLSPGRAIPGLRIPVLFLASPVDEIIPQKEVEEMHRTAPAGSKFHLCGKLPHLLMGLNFTELETLAVDWLALAPVAESGAPPRKE